MNHDVMNTMMIYVLLLQAQLFGNYHNVKLIYEVFSKVVGSLSIEYGIIFSHSFGIFSSLFIWVEQTQMNRCEAAPKTS